MDFKIVVIVLLTYFIRPQDWVPGMAGMNIVRPLMILAFLTMFTRRRGFSLASLFRTPHDWLMLVYGAYIVFTSPDFSETLQGVFALLAFYYVTSQALTTKERLGGFLAFWIASLVVVAGMAVAGEHVWDITGAHDITHMVPDNPRLVLNTYLFNNPNALGHTVILLIPICYFAFVWRRPMGKWLLGAMVVLLAGYCVYLTRSKGSYIVGLALLVGSQFIGRRLLVQIVYIALGLTMGIAAITQLPRMEQLSNVRQDEAILGRILAWEVSRTATEEYPTGMGWRQFTARILFEDEEIQKATHSAYVKIGADLGKYGLFIFVALLYCGFRSLLFARCHTDEDERSRRILFVLLLGYTLSAWMIDRAYHLEYFLVLGAISALHRRLGVESGVVDDADELLVDDEQGLTIDDPVDQGMDRAVSPRGRTIFELSEEEGREIIEEEISRLVYWRRFGIVDFIMSAGLFWLVFYVWDYVLLTL